MDKYRLLFCETARISMANELNIPPDDIDIVSIINCCERAIREACQKNSGEHIICCKNKEEEEAVLNKNGPLIIEKIFSREAPFFDWVDKYEEEYIKTKLKDIRDEWEMN